VKKVWLTVLLALVLASFEVIWLAPFWTAVLLYPVVTNAHGAWSWPQYLVLPVILAGLITSAWVTVRVWKMSREIPGDLQPKSPPGMELRESDAPELFQLAARLREQTGMTSPVEVWCDVSPTISAVAYAAHVAAGTKIALRNGMAAMAVMTREQLELLLRYHLTILTFSPRLMGFLLKARLLAGNMPYFLLYRKAFEAALRKVERYARELAGRLEETTAAIELSQELAVQFDVFWVTEIRLFLKTGNLMPVAEGFGQYWRRMRARAGLPEIAEADAALSMLTGPVRVESKLTAELLQVSPGLERISWEQGGVVLLESWAQESAGHAELLVGIEAGDVCRTIQEDGVALGSRLFEKPGRLHEPEELRRWTSQALGMALALALHRSGWRFLYAGAGSAMAFGKEEFEVEPFRVTQEMLEGKLGCEEWERRCEEGGIAGLQLE